MKSYIFEVILIDGYRIIRLDCDNSNKAFGIVTSWYPESIIRILE
jgi:hypothetical protein